MKLFLKKKNKIELSDKDIDSLVDFIKFCAVKLGIQKDMVIILIGKHDGDLGMSTGGYNTMNGEIMARVFGRCLVDIMRSIAHELVHQRQDEKGKFEGKTEIPNIGGEIEDEANAICGQLVKMYVAEKDATWLYTY